MKMAKWIVAVSLLFCLPVHANDWTKTDTAWQLTYTALHVADWGQTLHIRECDRESTVFNGQTYYKGGCDHSEGNPILGEYPSRGEVNTYFMTTLILHTAIAYYLPPKYRRVWQIAWIGVEANMVSHNINAGVKFSF